MERVPFCCPTCSKKQGFWFGFMGLPGETYYCHVCGTKMNEQRKPEMPTEEPVKTVACCPHCDHLGEVGTECIYCYALIKGEEEE